jgi:hypothetical protein
MPVGAFKRLRIPRQNTSAYERSLTSAYDPRPSAKAIGSIGVLVIILTFGLICLLDCVNFCIAKSDQRQKTQNHRLSN